jgi:hypothetical protein
VNNPREYSGDRSPSAELAMTKSDPPLRSKILQELETSMLCAPPGRPVDLRFELFYEGLAGDPPLPYVTNSRRALIAALVSALDKKLKVQELRLNGSVLSPPEFSQMMATAQWFQQEWARRRTHESSI